MLGGSPPADLVGRHQARPVIHRRPGLDLDRLGPAALPLGQSSQVGPVHRGVLAGIGGLQIGLANVVDHVVLLPGHHPALRGHLAEAEGQGPVHAQWVGAVLERARGEAERGRQRAGPVLRAVTVDADPLVDRLPALVALLAERADEPGVVDVAFRFRQGRGGQERRVGLQLASPLRALLGDLHQVSHQVEELLPRAQVVHQARRHDRRAAVLALLDLGLRDRDRLAVLRGVPEHDRVGPILAQQPRHRPPVVDVHRDGLIALLDRLRGIQDRLDEIHVGDVFPQRGQVGPEGGSSLLTDMALRAGQRGLIENRRPAPGVPQPAGVRGEGGGGLTAQRCFERTYRSLKTLAC